MSTVQAAPQVTSLGDNLSGDVDKVPPLNIWVLGVTAVTITNADLMETFRHPFKQGSRQQVARAALASPPRKATAREHTL